MLILQQQQKLDNKIKTLKYGGCPDIAGYDEPVSIRRRFVPTNISTSSEISATSLEDVERYKANYLCSYVIVYDVMIVESWMCS